MLAKIFREGLSFQSLHLHDAPAYISQPSAINGYKLKCRLKIIT